MTVRILTGHVLDRLAELPDESVHCCVTSPPYYGLRDYGIEPQVYGGEAGCAHEWGNETLCTSGRNDSGEQRSNFHGQVNGYGGNRNASTGAFCRHCNAWRGSLGLEPTPALYVEHMVAVFRAVRRVLRKDGTLWLNIGDSYASGGDQSCVSPKQRSNAGSLMPFRKAPTGFKPKDLLGIPWMLAFALRDDGWYLRSEITWAKRAPMPESVVDRPTSATEKVFLLSRSPRYYFDMDAVREPQEQPDRIQINNSKRHDSFDGECLIKANASGNASGYNPLGRNMRNWWLLGPEPFADAHFATFPSEIPRRAILAGCRVGGTVLDPFFGAGTTGLVADQLQRDCIGIELNPSYVAMAERRIHDDAPLFAHVEVRLPAANLLMRGGALAPVSRSNELDLETMQLSKPNATIGLEG